MRKEFTGYPKKDKKGRWYIAGENEMKFEAIEMEFHGFHFQWQTKKNL